MDGFDLLKEAFNKFASKLDAQDITARVVRSAAAGGKALVDKGLEEFPQSFVKNVVGDFYALISSQEVADGISLTVRSFDEEKVKEALDTVIGQIKQDDIALKLAKQLKEALSQASNDDLENAVDALLSGRSLSERMIAKAFFESAKPILEDLRDGDEETIAERIKELADTIPTDLIALQVGALTQEVTPDRVTKQAHDVVGKLPSPATIAEIMHGVGKAASIQFDRVSKAKTLGDAADALEAFASDAAELIQDKLAGDQSAKKSFGKKGGDFTL